MPPILGTLNPDVLFGTLLGDSVDGLGADDLIYGFDGNDTLNGGVGDDILYAGSGDDSIFGGAGEDMIFGQSGVDTVSYELAAAAVWLDLGNSGLSGGDAAGDVFTSIERFRLSAYGDTFFGTGTADYAEGDAGNDTLWGLAGNDQLVGGLGEDVLSGGLGNDTLNGGAGKDIASYADAVDNMRLDLINMGTSSADAAGDIYISIEGYALGVGHDEALATNTATLFRGNLGDDTLTGGTGADSLYGDAGSDRLFGGAGNDLLSAGDEENPETIPEINPYAIGGALFGGTGNDSLLGSNIGDSLSGDAGNDSLTGEAANDTLSGGTGNDTLNAGAGNDLLFGDAGADSLIGGDGFDTLTYSLPVVFNAGNATLSTKDALGDVASSIERIVMQGANSFYVGATTPVEIEFQASGGRMRSGVGAETVIGVLGDVAMDYTTAASAVRLTGAGATILGSLAAAGDVLSGVSSITLGAFADIVSLTGTQTGVARIYGAGGDDSYAATATTASLYGGSGNDTITGSVTGTNMATPQILAGDTGNDRIKVSLAGAPATFGVRLDGGDGSDTLTAMGGTDTAPEVLAATLLVYGGSSSDRVTLYASNISAYGGTGNDVMTVTGAETLLPGVAISVAGDDGNDRLTLRSTYGQVSGGSGNDVLMGVNTADLAQISLFGGIGNDSVTSTGSAVLMGGDGNDTLMATGWTLTAEGGNGDDRVTVQAQVAEAWVIHLRGGVGNDVLTLTASLDTPDSLLRPSVAELDGGSGNDVLNGTAPITSGGNLLFSEVFVFDTNWGMDSITGFDDGTDLIRISGGVAFGDLAIAALGGGSLISFGGNSIDVAGIAAASLTAADFLFL